MVGKGTQLGCAFLILLGIAVLAVVAAVALVIMGASVYYVLHG